MTDSFKIEIRNQKDAPVTVLVRERLYRWSNWKVSTQARYEKVNAGTIEFPVDVAPNAVQTISYSVEYTW